MDANRVIRVGFVGAGGIVKQRHLPGLRALPNVRITAVANSSMDSSVAFCREFAPEARPLARWENLVEDDQVDVVWIGAYPNLHHDVTCHALQSGKHVFTQARMAATLKEAEHMLEESLAHPGLVTAICPAPQGIKNGEMLKKLLADGAIGTPHQALLHSFTAAWLDPRQPAHWRQRIDLSGIQILTLGIYIEVLHRWLGHIGEVEARGKVVIPQRQGQNIATPDLVHVLARFESGVEAALLFSGVAAHAPSDRLWIFGSEGTLSYDFVSDQITLGRAGGDAVVPQPVPVPVPPELQREWTVERDFIRAVADPQAPRPKPDFAEGLAYMRVIEAVWEAMELRAVLHC